MNRIPLAPIKYADFNKVLNQEKNRKFISVPQPITNPNYGVFDIETFIDINENGERYSRVFALGFMTKTNKKPIMFYLTDHFEIDINNTSSSSESEKLVLKCIDEILISDYNNYIFYVHNLGKFDVIFLQKILLDYNLNVKEKYFLTPFYREDKILRLIVKVKLKQSQNGKYIKISFVDSLNLINGSLDQLSKDYNVKTKKGYFPYSFVNKNNLNYEGIAPNIEHYNSNVDKN